MTLNPMSSTYASQHFLFTLAFGAPWRIETPKPNLAFLAFAEKATLSGRCFYGLMKTKRWIGSQFCEVILFGFCELIFLGLVGWFVILCGLEVYHVCVFLNCVILNTDFDVS